MWTDREEGREALSQLQCDKGQPVRSETASLIMLSNLSRALIVTSGGRCEVDGLIWRGRGMNVGDWPPTGRLASPVTH